MRPEKAFCIACGENVDILSGTVTCHMARESRLVLLDWIPMIYSVPQDCNRWVDAYKDDFGFAPTSVALRTKTAPGSPERIEVLRRRIASGQPLFVRGDNTLDPSCRKYADEVSGTVWRGNDADGSEHSRCGRYQYRIWQRWNSNPNKPYPAFIGLCPSDDRIDRVLRACRSMSLQWGCAGFELLNLFGLKSQDSVSVIRSNDPIGDHNDRAIRLVTESASFTVLCWGRGGYQYDRSSRVLWALRKRIDSQRLLCFGLTELSLSHLVDGKMVGQPRSIIGLPKGAVTIPIPFDQVDANDDVCSLD